MKQSFTIILILICFQKGNSQQKFNAEADQKFKMAIVFGLTQPLVTNGFNVELNYYTKHFVFDYSHGFNLKFKDNLVVGKAKNQHLKFKVPHTLGFGIGYRITPELNIRIEPKLHIWEVFYENDAYEAKNRIKKYNTFTLGLGAYYRWLPFKKSDSFAQGLSIIPSFRWWPNIHSSLKEDKFEYFNKINNQNETHQANNIGVANTPFFGNISVGYSF